MCTESILCDHVCRLRRDGISKDEEVIQLSQSKQMHESESLGDAWHVRRHNETGTDTASQVNPKCLPLSPLLSISTFKKLNINSNFCRPKSVIHLSHTIIIIDITRNIQR